ncbi:MAG: hypothetical protein ROZ00_11170 [Denitratisoma sp.]|nr:hypothetical protein [Denitratisoma sp.]
MLDRFVEFFLLHPKRLVAVGEILYTVASALVVLGACTNVYTGAINAINRLSRQARSQSALADLLPGFPTWWVPETFVGLVFVIAIAIVGAVIAREGRNLERFFAN